MGSGNEAPEGLQKWREAWGAEGLQGSGLQG